MTQLIKVMVDGEIYEIEHKKTKDAPLQFEFTQKDMEYFMHILTKVSTSLPTTDTLGLDVSRIKRDLQHRIDKHIEKGDWK